MPSATVNLILRGGLERETHTLAGYLTGYPTNDRIRAINDAIRALKRAGIWAKYKTVVDLCPANTADVGRDWIRPGRALPTLIGTGAAGAGAVAVNKVANQSIYGDGSTGLNMGYALSGLGLETGNFREAFWSATLRPNGAIYHGARTLNQGTARATVGANSTTVAAYMNSLISAGGVFPAVDVATENGAFGMLSAQQIDSSTIEVYAQGRKLTTATRTAQAIPTVNHYLCGYNDGFGRLVETSATSRMSLWIVSEFLTEAEHVVENTIWKRYMKRIGNWKPPLLADGDSLTAGYLLQAWPDQFGQITYPQRQWVNTGVTGNTSSQIKARIMAKDTSLYRDSMLVFNMGRNDISGVASQAEANTAVATVLADMQAVVTWWQANTEGRYLVVGTHNGDSLNGVGGQGDARDYGPSGNVYYAREQLDAGMVAAFGDHAVLVHDALVAANDGSAGDLEDVANDICPRSLRRDYLHNNAAGSLVYAQRVEAQRSLCGYE